MMKVLSPDYLAGHADEVEPRFFLAKNIKAVLVDLDNTLAPVNEHEPRPQFLPWVERLKEAGLAVFIASNNHGERVATFARILGVEAAPMLAKPFKTRLLKWCKKKGFAPHEVALLGDQVYTDIIAAKRAKILCVLTEPLSVVDGHFTHVGRALDRRARKKIAKEGKIPHWRDAC